MSNLRSRRAPGSRAGVVLLGWLAVTSLVVVHPRASCAAEPEHNPEATKRSRRLYERGVALIKAGDQEQAIVAFEQAYEQKPLALFLYNIAQLHAWQGRPGKALDYYERFMAESSPTASERPEVEGKIRMLRAAMAASHKPTQPEATITATPVASPITSMTPSVTLAAQPITAAPPRKKRTWLWATLGVVGGLAIVGGVTAAVVVTTRSTSAPGTDLGNVQFSR